MNTSIRSKVPEKKNQSAAKQPSLLKSGDNYNLTSNSAEGIAQGKLQNIIDHSPQVRQLKAYQEIASNSEQVRQAYPMVNTYMPSQLRQTQTKAEQLGRASEVTQLFSYRIKEPIKGIPMAVRVEDNGARLLIVDITETDKNVGTLNGFIDYHFEGEELILDHFEAHPPGAGLGTLLMFELSQVAVLKGISTIAVATPALSAMGAYKSFGGKPRDEAVHEEYKAMYLNAMGENEEVHKSMVNEEAEAFAESETSKEKYFTPDLGAVGEANLFRGAKGDYKNAHSGEGDYERAADLKALSSQLIYNSHELVAKTSNSLTKKWDFV